VDLFSIIFIAVGLAMDAFAVSVASGLSIAGIRNHQAAKIALFFGGFQALMPVVGWLAGLSLREYIQSYDHWLAFVILGALGSKMLYEATFLAEGAPDRCARALELPVLLALSIATSLDALAVGVTFSFLNVTIFAPVAAIGAVTFVMSYGGVQIGKRFCNFPSAKVEALGGVILIAIGAKILIEHLARGI
jgi:putative Mn2+ efflux pump MntP